MKNETLEFKMKEYVMIDNLKDVRWKQRFQNFEKSYKLLNKYSTKENITELERAGIIHLFEMSFELAWKVLKDYLEYEEFEVKSPRQTIKQAFQIELIENGHVWIDVLADRNLTTHTYNEQLAKELIEDIIRVYLPELDKMYEKLLKEV